MPISDHAFPENFSFHRRPKPYYTDRKLGVYKNFVTILLVMYLLAKLAKFILHHI